MIAVQTSHIDRVIDQFSQVLCLLIRDVEQLRSAFQRLFRTCQQRRCGRSDRRQWRLELMSHRIDEHRPQLFRLPRRFDLMRKVLRASPLHSDCYQVRDPLDNGIGHLDAL